MFHKLPWEILDTIISAISNKSDLAHLGRASKQLMDVCIPKLYHDFIVSSRSDHRLYEIDAEPFVAIPNLADRIKHIRSITFSAPLRDVLSHRCCHFRDTFGLLRLMAFSILQRLEYGTLEEFRWEVGSCIPLKAFKNLTTTQKSISSLSVITDPSCRLPHCRISIPGKKHPQEHDVDQKMLTLLKFSDLRTFSWVGFREADCRILMRTLERNRHQLQSLTLEATYRSYESVSEDETDMGDLYDYVPLYHIFPVDTPRVIISFDSLVSLRLSNIALRRMEEFDQFASAFDNLGNLRSFTLHDCTWVKTLLIYLANSEAAKGLKKLEISEKPVFYDKEPPNALGPFLESFSGLEALHYLMRGPDDTADGYWKAFLHQKSTLKQLVYHERSCEIHDRSKDWSNHPEWEDGNLAMKEDVADRACNWVEPELAMHRMLESPCLEAVGICDDLNTMKLHMANMVPRPSIKLLHVRRSDLTGEIDMVDDETRSSPPSDLGPEVAETSQHQITETSHEPFQAGQNKDLPGANNQQEAQFVIPSSPRPLNNRRITCPNRLPLPPKLFSFAKWAFGEDGLPNLLIIAYGDFSHSGRFGPSNRILGRSTGTKEGGESRSSFEFVGKGDWKHLEWVDGYFDVLSACPVKPLMDYFY